MIRPAMILVVFALAPPTRQPIPLQQRCAIVRSILSAKAKQPIPADPHLAVAERAFTEIEGVDRQTRRAGRTVIRAEVVQGKIRMPLFQSTESCDADAFLLEHEETRGPEHDRDPQGKSELVVKIEIRRDSASRPLRFRFEERLGLGKHSYPPGSARKTGGGYAVPPARYSGEIEQRSDGSWRATVEKAIFAM